MTTKKQTPPHLLLHNLIVALSYWGSATRVLLISFLALAIITLRILEAQTSTSVPFTESLLTEGQLFVYTIGSFLILDIGYVIIARAYGFAKLYDIIALLALETILAVAYFLPYLAVVSEKFASVTQWIFLAVLFILSVRLLVGILYGKPAKK
jgi:hypothetical protein